MVRGSPAHLKNFVVDLYLVSDIKVGDSSAQLDELNAVGLIGPRYSRGKVAALNQQRQGDHYYNDHNGQHR